MTKTKKYRVPDGIADPETERHLVEIKDVDKLSLSDQIKDSILHVTRDGGSGQVDIVVDTRTKVYEPLMKLHRDPESPVNIIREPLRE